MSLVATLITHPDRPILSEDLALGAAQSVGATKVTWLSAGVACDISPAHEFDAPAAEARLRDAVAGHPIDVVAQDAAGRRKKLLLADMDSTMIEQECIDELADEVGLKDKVAAITARSMNGEIAFEPALRERVALLKGLGEDVIPRIIERRIKLASGARTLVRTMRANGAWTALVSGGFTAFTGPIAFELEFDENRANRLLSQNGVLTGFVAEPILGREAKAAALREIAREHGLEISYAIVVGDGANDLDMIRIAGAGVALHAKPSVAAAAPMRIDHGDLTALLYIQGYRDSDFVR